jgi:nicotinamide phosphoribosyltransferase
MKSLEKTSDDLDQIAFKLHDFGARGVSSHESAEIGGVAHLVNFLGSDTVEGILAANKYYHHPMAGFSIPAAEHSTMTSWGRDHEVDAYRNMLKQFAKPGSIVAVVSDSWDIMNAASNIWGRVLKEEVIKSGATIVVRPDSGDPMVVPINVIEALGEKFGYTYNTKGYRVLPSCIRVIQGDGIDVDSLPKILNNLNSFGWATDNIAFGMGGGLLQNVNRDTQKFAMKCSSVTVNGKDREVYKDPITDPGKVSKKGELALVCEGNEWKTVPKFGNAYRDLLTPIFHNGDLQESWTLDEIRDTSNRG